MSVEFVTFRKTPAINCQPDNGTVLAEDNLLGVYYRYRLRLVRGSDHASCESCAISSVAGLGSLELLPSDLGQVSVGEEQHRTRLYELSNLARVSTCRVHGALWVSAK